MKQYKKAQVMATYNWLAQLLISICVWVLINKQPFCYLQKWFFIQGKDSFCIVVLKKKHAIFFATLFFEFQFLSSFLVELTTDARISFSFTTSLRLNHNFIIKTVWKLTTKKIVIRSTTPHLIRLCTK